MGGAEPLETSAMFRRTSDPIGFLGPGLFNDESSNDKKILKPSDKTSLIQDRPVRSSVVDKGKGRC